MQLQNSFYFSLRNKHTTHLRESLSCEKHWHSISTGVGWSSFHNLNSVIGQKVVQLHLTSISKHTVHKQIQGYKQVGLLYNDIDCVCVCVFVVCLGEGRRLNYSVQMYSQLAKFWHSRLSICSLQDVCTSGFSVSK